MKRYYLVEVETTSPRPEEQVDRALLRHLHHAFRLEDHRVWLMPMSPTLASAMSESDPLQYDPIIDDGNEPEGYVSSTVVVREGPEHDKFADPAKMIDQ